MPRLTKFRCDRNLKEWSRFRHAKYIHSGGENLVKKGNKKLRPLIALEDLNHSGFNLFDPNITYQHERASSHIFIPTDMLSSFANNVHWNFVLEKHLRVKTVMPY